MQSLCRILQRDSLNIEKVCVCYLLLQFSHVFIKKIGDSSIVIHASPVNICKA